VKYTTSQDIKHLEFLFCWKLQADVKVKYRIQPRWCFTCGTKQTRQRSL